MAQLDQLVRLADRVVEGRDVQNAILGGFLFRAGTFAPAVD
jgi:hypothetical protein